MLIDASDRPGIDESYQTASNTSNLTVEADRRGAGDVLIAAGWSPSRVGMAMLRLQSEYDGGEASQRRKQASATDAALMLGRLKSLGPVRDQLAMIAFDWHMEAPKVKAEAVVLWWLDRVCPRCTGRKFELMPGAPVLSGRWCKVCNGVGEARLPHGQEGRKLANYLDQCVFRARQSLKNRLRPENR